MNQDPLRRLRRHLPRKAKEGGRGRKREEEGERKEENKEEDGRSRGRLRRGTLYEDESPM